MKQKLSFPEFVEIIKTVKQAKSAQGNATYVITYCDDKLCLGIRKPKNTSFEIKVPKLYEAYCQCDTINTVSLKPYVPRVQSPSLAILSEAKLI